MDVFMYVLSLWDSETSFCLPKCIPIDFFEIRFRPTVFIFIVCTNFGRSGRMVNFPPVFFSDWLTSYVQHSSIPSQCTADSGMVLVGVRG